MLGASRPVDAVTLGRRGLVGAEEEAKVMPAFRLAVVRDDQVRARPGSSHSNALDIRFSCLVRTANPTSISCSSSPGLEK